MVFLSESERSQAEAAAESFATFRRDGLLRAHSQTVITRQPARLRSRTVAESFSWFFFIFESQKARFVAGTLKR
jgi:hypothetical protein